METFDLNSIEPNPLNPRVITDKQFAELVASIIQDPDMLRFRPIVFADNLALGGNMRHRAILTATENADFRKRIGTSRPGIVPADWVRDASDWTDDERRRFVIKDNAPKGMSGDWDYDMLANMPTWNDLPLDDWGLAPDIEELTSEESTTPSTDTASLKIVTCPKCSHAFEI